METPRAARRVVVIGLGGIYEGYGPQLPLFHTTGLLPMEELYLIDGDRFDEKNRLRQHVGEIGAFKALARQEQLAATYPEVPVRAIPEYVTPENVANFICENAVVLLSPDNHPTRLLVSRHCQTLDNALLIIGANSGINDPRGIAGQYGLVHVYARKGGEDVTAPMELYHPELTTSGEPPPWDPSCAEAVSTGNPQVLATNLLVGSWMLWMLDRYCRLPWAEAQTVAEVALHVGTGSVVPYWRPPDVSEGGN